MSVDPVGCRRSLPRAVEVLHDRRWVRGVLLAAYRSEPSGRWRGIVRYAVAPGEQYQQARWAEELRPAGDPGEEPRLQRGEEPRRERTEE